MPGNPSNPKLKFEMNLGTSPRPQPRRRDESSPLGILILGNFAGHSSGTRQHPVAQRRAMAVDSDNFEAVLAGIAPTLRVQISSGPNQPTQEVDLQFASIEDFHPDAVVGRVPRLRFLSEQRRRLLDPKTAEAAAQELAASLSAPATDAPPAPSETASAPASKPESTEDTLARLLGGAPRPASTAAAKPQGFEGFIKQLVSSSAVPTATSQQKAVLSLAELELTTGLRAVLHDAAFQSLEAAWRGVDRLVRLFGGEEDVKLYVADIDQDELPSGVQEGAGLAQFIRRATDEHELAVCLGLYTFGPDLRQLGSLERLLESTAAAGLLLLSAASPALLGCDSIESQPAPEDWRTKLPADVAEAWQALRAHAEANSLGLALPQFLLRQPYGRQGDVIESFPFEELPASGAHGCYLWGNPALACGQLIAEAFLVESWQMQLTGYGEVGDIPVHRFTSDEGKQVKPCAEAWLSERAGEAMLEQGFIPILSVKGRDSVLVPRLQSVTGAVLGLPD